MCLGSRISNQQQPMIFEGKVVHSSCCQVGRPLLAERPDMNTQYIHNTGPGEEGCGAQWWVRKMFPKVMFVTLPSILFHSTTSLMGAKLSPQITKCYWECCIFTRLQKKGNYGIQKSCKNSRRKRIYDRVLMQVLCDALNKWIKCWTTFVWIIILNYSSLLILWWGISLFR